MKRSDFMKRFLFILAGVLSIAACKSYYFDPYFEKVELGENIPQAGSVIEIPVDYRQVDTKFQPGMAYRPFRYRVLADEVQFSYGICTQPIYDNLEVVVPANDSYHLRDIAVEVSYSGSYDADAEEWGEWIRIFHERQGCLEDGAELVEPKLMDKQFEVRIGDVSLTIVPADNGSVMPLKRLLLNGPVEFDANVYGDLITTGNSANNDILRNAVPRNHTSSNECGGLYMNDEGVLFLINDYHPRNSTLIGKVATEDMSAFFSVLSGPENQKMTLSLQ